MMYQTLSGVKLRSGVINSVKDNIAVKINSRDFNQTSGSSIGVQIKPNQATAGASVRGLEVQPRFASAIGGADLVGANISGILKGVTGNLSGAVHVLEVETDFSAGSNPTRTIAGDVSMLRISGDFPLGMTFSGTKNIIELPAVNTGQFDYFLKADASQSFIGIKGSDYSLSEPRCKIPIKIGNVVYYLIGYTTAT